MLPRDGDIQARSARPSVRVPFILGEKHAKRGVGIDAEASAAFPSRRREISQQLTRGAPEVLGFISRGGKKKKLRFCFPSGTNRIVFGTSGRGGIGGGFYLQRWKRRGCEANPSPSPRGWDGILRLRPAKKLSGNGGQQKFGEEGPRHGAAGLGRVPWF